MKELLDAVGTTGLGLVLAIFLVWSLVGLVKYLLAELKAAHTLNAETVSKMTTSIDKVENSLVQVAKSMDHFRESNEECQRSHAEMLNYFKGRDSAEKK